MLCYVTYTFAWVVKKEFSIYLCCFSRCSMYKLPKDCVLVTDPEDSCCRVPFCSPVIPSTSVPSPGTTLAPVTGPDGSTLFPPTVAPTQGPNVIPTRPPFLVPTGVPGTQIGTINNPNHTPGSNESIGECLLWGSCWIFVVDVCGLIESTEYFMGSLECAGIREGICVLCCLELFERGCACVCVCVSAQETNYFSWKTCLVKNLKRKHPPKTTGIEKWVRV